MGGVYFDRRPRAALAKRGFGEPAWCVLRRWRPAGGFGGVKDKAWQNKDNGFTHLPGLPGQGFFLPLLSLPKCCVCASEKIVL